MKMLDARYESKWSEGATGLYNAHLCAGHDVHALNEVLRAHFGVAMPIITHINLL
jgi:hypothetical protein